MRFFSVVFPLSLLFAAVKSVNASILDALCNGAADDSSLLLHGETKGFGAAVQVGETTLSDSQSHLSVLQWHPISIDGGEPMRRAFLRFGSWQEAATKHVELNGNAELCSDSSDRNWSSFLTSDISSGTTQIRFLTEGPIEVEVWAELLDGSLVFEAFSLRVDRLESHDVQTPNAKGSTKASGGEQVHDNVSGTAALTVKEKGVLSATSQARSLHQIETRELPWSFSTVKSPVQNPTQQSMMDRFFSSPTATATGAPSPSPAKTFTPTRTMQPTVSFTPTFSTKCDYKLNCPSPLWIDRAASVVIEDYVFPCRAVIQFAELGLVAPSVCEVSMADVQAACDCGRGGPRIKRTVTRTTAPTPTPSVGPTEVPAIEFFAEECKVCDVVDESLPLEIDGIAVTCGDVKEYGVMGMVPPNLCPAAQQLAKEYCKCQGDSNVITKTISWLEEVVAETTTTTATTKTTTSTADSTSSACSSAFSPLVILLLISSIWTLWASN